MEIHSVGFVGGGRIVRILLAALQRKNHIPRKIVVSDSKAEVLHTLQKSIGNATITLESDNARAAEQDIVFIAVHPPAMRDVLSEIAPHLQKNAVVISLAPKFRIAAVSGLLNGHRKIVRMIPNAATLLNSGFNPVSFSSTFSDLEKQNFLKWFGLFGQSPIVDEGKLEAYAIMTAMGPTYFWFQFSELHALSGSFGLSSEETTLGIKEMVRGSLEVLYDSGLSYQEVTDLIPVKPIGEHEDQIREFYRSKLSGLYDKLAE